MEFGNEYELAHEEYFDILEETERQFGVAVPEIEGQLQFGTELPEIEGQLQFSTGVGSGEQDAQ